jgi:hypothetical protein
VSSTGDPLRDVDRKPAKGLQIALLNAVMTCRMSTMPPVCVDFDT